MIERTLRGRWSPALLALALLTAAGCRERPTTAPPVAGTWTGSASGIHFHVVLARSGRTLSLGAGDQMNSPMLMPMDAAASAALGTKATVPVESIDGSFADTTVNFTVHYAQPTGSLAYQGHITGDTIMYGMVSGAKLPPTPLRLVRWPRHY